jgi:hypothetical protein
VLLIEKSIQLPVMLEYANCARVVSALKTTSEGDVLLCLEVKVLRVHREQNRVAHELARGDV